MRNMSSQATHAGARSRHPVKPLGAAAGIGAALTPRGVETRLNLSASSNRLTRFGPMLPSTMRGFDQTSCDTAAVQAEYRIG